MDKLASPFCTWFYRQGLNTHKDTNDSQIKINIKISLFGPPQNSVIQKLLFELCLPLVVGAKLESREEFMVIIPIKSVSFVRPCRKKVRGEPGFLLELWCAVAGGREVAKDC